MKVPYPRAILLLLVAVTAARPFWDTLHLDASMASDTRQAARAWLVREACPGERILLEGSLNTGDGMVPAYSPVLPDYCHATYRYSLARASAEVEQFDVVVASSFMYERFLRLVPEGDPNRRFYEEFFAQHRPVAEFLPTHRSYGFHNPTIRVYRLRDQHG